MPHERDADDTRLLEEGNLAALLAKYQPVILGRCIARLRGDEDAEDVAQNVMLRLVAEFQRGKRYSVPFRVVVHQVTTWTIAEYFEGKPIDVPLPEGWDPPAPDFSEDVDRRDFLSSLFGSVGEKTRKVLAGTCLRMPAGRRWLYGSALGGERRPPWNSRTEEQCAESPRPRGSSSRCYIRLPRTFQLDPDALRCSRPSPASSGRGAGSARRHARPPLLPPRNRAPIRTSFPS